MSRRKQTLTRQKLAIHQELMDQAVSIMRPNGNGKDFAMVINNNFMIVMAQEEILSKKVVSLGNTEKAGLGLKFGDMVRISNDFYSKTYAIYLGSWFDPHTPNNKLKQHWFMAESEEHPHYYGDGDNLSPQDFLKKFGIRLELEATPEFARSFLRRIK